MTLDPWSERFCAETIRNTVAQQRAKLETYRALKEQGLPIPKDLKAEIEGQGLK